MLFVCVLPVEGVLNGQDAGGIDFVVVFFCCYVTLLVFLLCKTLFTNEFPFFCCCSLTCFQCEMEEGLEGWNCKYALTHALVSKCVSVSVDYVVWWLLIFLSVFFECICTSKQASKQGIRRGTVTIALHLPFLNVVTLCGLSSLWRGEGWPRMYVKCHEECFDPCSQMCQ